MQLRFGSVMFLGLALAACGSDDSLPDSFKDQLRVGCAKGHACKASWDPSMHNNESFEHDYGTSVDDCYNMTIAGLNQLAPGYLDALDASVAAGRITFDADAAEVCNNALEDASCDAVFGQNGATFDAPPACSQALTGTVASGGACTLDDDCIEGSCEQGACL